MKEIALKVFAFKAISCIYGTFVFFVVLFVEDYCGLQNGFVRTKQTSLICNYFSKHMAEKQGIIIHIPESLSHVPVQIIRSSNHRQLIFALQSESDTYAEELPKKYVFILCNQDYVKVLVDDIVWIKANKSYSCIHLKDGQDMLVSSNLSAVEKRLPEDDFIRIHRYCVINIRHVTQLIGRTLFVEDESESFPIGREYRESVLDRFIFLGIRRKRPK